MAAHHKVPTRPARLGPHLRGKLRKKWPGLNLNLLAYCTGRRGLYLYYVAAVSACFGKAVGAETKFVGQVVQSPPREGWFKAWEDVAIVTYPSIYHFAYTLGDERYQKIDAKYMDVAVLDTAVLCLTEL
jgi:hypothetical protein